MIRRWMFLSMVLMLACAELVHGQTPTGTNRFRRINPAFISAFREVVAKVAASTVRVLADGKETALGVVVGPEGWILTKANDLKGRITCRLKDGRSLEARVIGVYEPHDLALLRVEAHGLPAVSWTKSSTTPVGAWVACAGPATDPVAFGVVSAAARDLPNKGGPILTNAADAGYIGIALDTAKDGIRITQVLTKTPAAQVGLKADDIILALNGKMVSHPQEFIGEMQKLKAGQEVHMQVKRAGSKLNFKIKLARRPPDRGDIQNMMGSALSTRRSGYPTVLQFDAVIKPADCGSPLVNLDGQVIGLAISRAGRAESWAIPAEAIQPILFDLVSGKYPPSAINLVQASAPAKRNEIEAAREDLKKAEAEMAILKARLAELQKALDRAAATLQKARDELQKALKKESDRSRSPQSQPAGKAAMHRTRPAVIALHRVVQMLSHHEWKRAPTSPAC
jgi:serine protease Do